MLCLTSGACPRHQVKRNLLNVSYRIAQYTDVISDLRREIEHLKSKIEKQDKKKSDPSVLDVQGTAKCRPKSVTLAGSSLELRAQRPGSTGSLLLLARGPGPDHSDPLPYVHSERVGGPVRDFFLLFLGALRWLQLLGYKIWKPNYFMLLLLFLRQGSTV